MWWIGLLDWIDWIELDWIGGGVWIGLRCYFVGSSVIFVKIKIKVKIEWNGGGRVNCNIFF